RGASEALAAALRGFGPQALHAETLEFTHPASGEPLRCTAPVPAATLAPLAALREDAALHAEAERARRWWATGSTRPRHSRPGCGCSPPCAMARGVRRRPSTASAWATAVARRETTRRWWRATARNW